METTTLMNDGIEQTILATLMWPDNINVMEIISTCKREFFYNERRGQLFQVLKDRYEAGKPLSDAFLVYEDVKASKVDLGLEDIMTLSGSAPAMAITEDIDRLRDLYLRRRMVNAMLQYQSVFQDVTTDVARSVSQLTELLVSVMGLSDKTTVSLEDVLVDLRQVISNNLAGLRCDSMLTGFRELDIYGGLHPCDLVTIAADSSQGKTAFAMTIAVNAAKLSGAKVAIFSLEMSSLELGARILSPEVSIPASKLLYWKPGRVSQEKIDSAIRGLQGIGQKMFFGDASVQSIDEIITSIRLHHARYGVRLVIVDYIQIVNCYDGHDSLREEQQLGMAARRLKNIAKELDITVVELSQLNRDHDHIGNHEPTVSRLRGSGQVNEASDMTALVYRPERYSEHYLGDFAAVDPHGTAMIKVVKDRNGGYGGVRNFIVRFNAGTTQFTDLENAKEQRRQ